MLLDQDQDQVDQTTGLFWVAGGGGGGDETNPQPQYYGLVVEEVIKLQNHHYPQMLLHMQVQEVEETAGTKIGGDAIQNTGSGGGGGGHDSAYRTAGNGGSGLVLIAYPT